VENLMAVVSYINMNFATSIHLLEASSYNNGILAMLLPKNVHITFIEDHDPVFHRTYYINKLLEQAKTPVVAVWDADVLVARDQVEKAVSLIRQNEAQFVLPFSGRFLNTSMLVREMYFKQKEISILQENEDKMERLYGDDPVGGGFFANRKAYTESGMENEYFYGWGHEDGERVNRWNILGYRFQKIDGCLYHLSHHRSINSRYHSKRQQEIKMTELERLGMMSKEEMEREVKSWS
jgi:predicted glycosyltransferase involved in capsule biosynthesis